MNTRPDSFFYVTLTVSVVLLTGVCLALWGMIVSNAALFILGVAVTWLGLVLQAGTLRKDGI